MTKNIVLYHANCADGFGAAFSAWITMNGAEFRPMSYNIIKTWDDAKTLGIEGANVFILDFSFPREVMDYIFEFAKHTTWLDHHKTAFETWVPNLIVGPTTLYTEQDEQSLIILDNARSGAAIAWDYFVAGGQYDPDTDMRDAIYGRPMLIAHIDDYDRWQFKFDGTKAFARALRSMEPWDFTHWYENLMIDTTYEEGYRRFLDLGETLLREHNKRVLQSANYAVPCSMGNVTGAACNAPPDMASDLGHLLAKQTGTFGMTWTMGTDGKINGSLRSTGDFDVSAIAKQYNGGGHKNAAGFEVTLDQLREILGV